MTQTRTGRPPHYSHTQVLTAIDLIEKSGDMPSGENIKKVLCGQLGVSPGINAQSLQGEVDRLLEERSRARRERLVAALPMETLTAAKEIGARIQAAVLGHLGEEHDRLRTAAGARIVELTADLDIERRQIRDLWERIAAKDGDIADLESAKRNLEERLDAAMAETVSLQSRLAALDQQEDLHARIVEIMREAMTQNSSAVARA